MRLVWELNEEINTKYLEKYLADSMQYMLVIITVHDKRKLNERDVTRYSSGRDFPVMEIRGIFLKDRTQELGLCGAWVEFRFMDICAA